MLHKSIRFRIQFWHSLLLIATTAGLSISYYFYEKQNRLRLVDDTLHNESIRYVTMADRFVADRFPETFPRRSAPPRGEENRPPPRHLLDREPGPPPSLEEREERLNEQTESTHSFLYVWDNNLNLVYQTRNATLTPPAPPNLLDKGNARVFLSNKETRAIFTRTLNGATIAIAKDTRLLQAKLDDLALALLAIDLTIILLGISVGWILTGRAIRPIQTINETAKQIADGQRNKRIDVSNTDCELSQLADVLNKTFDKLDHSFEQQVKFTADASHELRTPVAALLTQIQLALARDRTIGEYQEHLQACQNQAVRMRDLLNSLLDLARSDSGEIQYSFEDYDLAELIMECCQWLESLAEQKSVTFQTELEPINANIDGLRMGQVFTNILSNAIGHSPDQGRIDISLTRETDKAIITISDQGPGIPEEAKEHIFERFYRASKSRTSGQGSVGLGLAIAKTIVDKHTGKISADSDSSGTTFTIELPLTRS